MSGKRPRTNRSVADCHTANELQKVLMSMDTETKMGGRDRNSRDGPHPNTEAIDTEKPDRNLPSFDFETGEVQSMKQELHRLQVLKSYLILDSEPDESFDRITALGSRMFNVPMCVICMVDLGRVWLVSNRGMGDCRECQRSPNVFCTHVIKQKDKFLFVPDATKDSRFQDNPMVTGPMNIRFYAGVPLISPEGYKLGTFCIMDRTARHNELTSDEQASLHDFSEMCVKAMVDRRYRLQRQGDNPAQLIANTAHDLMTPLQGVQTSLSLLKESKLNNQQHQLLTTASKCSELMFRMAQTTVETLRQGSAPLSSSIAPQAPDNMQTPAVTDTIQITKLAELVKSLIAIMDPIPKQVPLIITLDPSGPPAIIGDDLKLFRSALNLVSHAIDRTELGWVHLKIYPKTDSIEDNNQSHLVFECEDTGSNIEVEEYQYLFQPSRKTEENNIRLGLSSVASLINSLDGEYGFRPRAPISDPKGRQRPGANFWFSVPLFIPETSSATAGNFERNGSSHSMSRYPSIPVLHRPSSGSRLQINGSNGSLSSSLSSSLTRRLSSESIGDRRNIFWDQNAAQKIAAAVDKNMFTKPKQNKQNTSEVAAGSADTKSAPNIASRPRERRALVIDDSSVVRKSLAMALKRKLGYSVSLAVDGLDGLNKLKEAPFDLCLCDFLMPVMDGMDCVKQFREWEKENRPWDRQLIIGISAHASANDGGRGIKAGMDDFKPKPITIKTLTEVHDSDSVTARAKILNELEEYFGQQKQLVANFCEKAPPNAVAEVPTEAEQAMKLKRAQSRSKNHVSNEKVCLIATNSPIIKYDELLTKLKGKGWNVVVVHDGEEALRSLQTRNWDVVLIDDDIPVLVGAPFITTFRRWEGQDRINRQRNIFLLVDGDIPAPSDKASIVQPPSGLDGVLRKPVDWDDLQYMIQKGPKAGSLEIIVKQ